MLGSLYGQGENPRLLNLTQKQFLVSSITGGNLTPNQDLGIKAASPVGTLVGQLVFGWLADIVGRKRMCMYLLFNLAFHFLN
jgi:MFS family permease